MAPSRPQKKHQHSSSAAAGLPGVQKIKSQIRQTTRLLAKDKLAADVRVETERRLKSLQTDLAKAELGKKERTLAVKYHKVKFFEKKKAIRIINQTKRELSELPIEDAKSRKKLEKKLFEQRADLNYIINFPTLEKYVSLFPNASPGSAGPAPSEPSSSKSITDKRREELREWVRLSMKNGEMEAEPEVTGAKNKKSGSARATLEEDGHDGSSDEDNDGEDEEMPPVQEAKEGAKQASKKMEKQKKKKAKDKADSKLTLDNDDFFGDDA